MKRTLIILCTMIATVTTATAQQEKIIDKAWTNGDSEYEVTSKGNMLLFQGFDWHEGGFGFTLNKQADGTMAVSDLQHNVFSFSCPEQYLGGILEYKVLNGQEVLLVRNVKGALVDVFINNNMIDMLTSSVVSYLAGSYSGSDGKVYVFSADAPRVSGFGNKEQYTVEALYYLPGFIISFEGSNPYLVTGDTRSDVNGITLHFQPCVKNEYDDWEPQETGHLELVKTNWNNAVADKTIQSKYSYTSVKIMTHGELHLFTLNELDIMRNEIYARHGYIFKTARYRDYFNAQPWYKGTVNDAASLLSEIERLNVEQIVAVQEIIKNAN